MTSEGRLFHPSSLWSSYPQAFHPRALFLGYTSCKAYPWDLAIRGLEYIQTPVELSFSGALPGALLSSSIQISVLFHFCWNLSTFSINLKGTPFSFIYPWRIYHKKFRHLQRLGELSDFKGFNNCHTYLLSGKSLLACPLLEKAVGEEGKGNTFKLLSQCIILQHFHIKHGHAIKENVLKERKRKRKIKTMAFLALDFDLLWFSTEKM